MSDYTGKSSEELLEIAKARGLSLRKNASEETIIEALEESDKATDEAASAIQPQPPTPLPAIEASPLPYVKPPDHLDLLNPSQPFNDEYTHGIYVMNNGPLEGELFALCVTEPDNYENTHFLKNNVHFWGGRKEQFKQFFDKK